MNRLRVYVQAEESKKAPYGAPSYTVCMYIAGTEYVYENLSYHAMCGLYNSRCGILQFIRDEATGEYLR